MTHDTLVFYISQIIRAAILLSISAFLGAVVLRWAAKWLTRVTVRYWSAYKIFVIVGFMGLIAGFLIGFIWMRSGGVQGGAVLIAMLAGFPLSGWLYGILIKKDDGAPIGFGLGIKLASVVTGLAIGLLLIIIGLSFLGSRETSGGETNSVVQRYRTFLQAKGKATDRSDLELTFELGNAMKAAGTFDQQSKAEPEFRRQYLDVAQYTDRSVVGEIPAGVGRAVNSLKGMATGALAFGLDVVGADETAAGLRTKAREHGQNETAAANAATVASMDDVYNVESAVRYAFGKLGEAFTLLALVATTLFGRYRLKQAKQGRTKQQMKPIYAIVAAIVLIALFPPVDKTVPADRDLGRPEYRLNQGFKFIGDMNQMESIRMPQWLVHFAIAGLVAGLLGAAFRKKPV